MLIRKPGERASKLDQLGRYLSSAVKGAAARRRRASDDNCPATFSASERVHHSPAWEIWETAGFVIVRLHIPGLADSTPDDLKLRVKGEDVLVVAGRARSADAALPRTFEARIDLSVAVSPEIAEVTKSESLITVILAKAGDPLPPGTHG
jgi:HSP20 family molecular chaperone IbpA